MKKYILLIIGLILLTCSGAYAEEIINLKNPLNNYTKINFKQPSKDIPDLAIQMIHLPGFGGPSGDSCTGGLVLSWHMEDLDLANEDGCSTLGDTTWAEYGVVTLTSSDKSEGTYSGYASTTYDYHTLDVSSGFPLSEGTVWVDFRINNWTATTNFFTAPYDGSNAIRLNLVNSASDIYVECVYMGEGSYQSVWVGGGNRINTTNNTWWRIKLEWKLSASAADIRGTVTELDSSSPRQTTGTPMTTTDNADSTLMTNQPVYVRVGATNAGSTALYWDNLKIYNTSDM